MHEVPQSEQSILPVACFFFFFFALSVLETLLPLFSF